jgi:hypothetical protein
MIYISKIDGLWYAFEGDLESNTVWSIGPDNPTYENRWTARWTDAGIKYVARGVKSKASAIKKAGDYYEEI